jgi:hypothetical protein
MNLTRSLNSRHPELVSGSISPLAQVSRAEGWMLKQVQHDGVGSGGA